MKKLIKISNAIIGWGKGREKEGKMTGIFWKELPSVAKIASAIVSDNNGETKKMLLDIIRWSSCCAVTHENMRKSAKIAQKVLNRHSTSNQKRKYDYE
jgi:hypothetical protein